MFILWTYGKKNEEEILCRQCPRINYVSWTTLLRTFMMVQTFQLVQRSDFVARAQEVVPVLQDAYEP